MRRVAPSSVVHHGATRSAIMMVGKLVLALGTRGITEASTTRRLIVRKLGTTGRQPPSDCQLGRSNSCRPDVPLARLLRAIPHRLVRAFCACWRTIGPVG